MEHEMQREPAAAEPGGEGTIRRTYFVTVQAESGGLQPPPGLEELEIRASEEEMKRLHRQFEELPTAGEAGPGQPPSAGQGKMLEMYKLLYRLGTPDTKTRMASAGLLPEESRP
ncbi:hypothetical protein [Paenibacillus humicola]|uniref:hypothetical protein n=1 Tax=Paenibacillus humicola TaxID=3110540 RepID=UPI00237B6832|nr:hypothetical protein [Paenibacillus humicola]